MKNLVIGFGLFITIIFTSISCTKPQIDKDKEIILKYISDNNLSATEIGTSGLYYVISKPGGSQHPTAYSTVTVNYTGYLINGTVFGKEDTTMLSLPQTIYGWQMGVPLIGEGGSIKLLIPSQYGYGTTKMGDIPKNSVLIFDIDLILFN
ncbi:MAG: hypothetical protein AUJ98_06980 [Bacteroidetes bacterium CG2_30_33_31]|nr:MAG: hypothetical protein AUJ98_06980 [Bacteroidetes bacterium CG2_30_33_31]